MLVRLIGHYEMFCTYKTKNTHCAQLQALRVKAVLCVLKATSGIENVSYDNNENILSVEYDALKIDYSKIATILTDQKINQTKGIGQRLLSIWHDYLDTTTRDNALARPQPIATNPLGGNK
jgi:hypothetical protein